MFRITIYKLSFKFLIPMTQKDVSLYYNVKVYIKKNPQKCHIEISLSILTNILSNEFF